MELPLPYQEPSTLLKQLHTEAARHSGSAKRRRDILPGLHEIVRWLSLASRGREAFPVAGDVGRVRP